MKILSASLANVSLSKTEKSKYYSLTVFHEDELCFWLILDGEKKNNLPQSKVVVEKIRHDKISLAIIFADEKIDHLIREIQLQENKLGGKETNIKIRQKTKTKAVMVNVLGHKKI